MFDDMSLGKRHLARVGQALLPAAAALALSVGTAHAQAQNPTSLAYPARLYDGRRTPVDLSTRQAWLFRTRLRMAAQQWPNFAGHYVVVQWGCGTDCSQGAAIDLKDGKVTWLPGAFGAFERRVFRLSSRLMEVDGYPSEDAMSAGAPVPPRYYVMRRDRLSLMPTVPGPVEGRAFQVQRPMDNEATAFTIPANTKCASPRVIGRIPGRYSPTPGPQEVIISEKQEGSVTKNGYQIYCLVDIRIYRWIPQGISVNTGEFEMSGPGLVFSNGYWHPYPGEIDDKVQKVRLLPLGDYIPPNTFVGVGEYGPDQLLTYNHMRGVVSEFSHLNITGFWSPRSWGGSVVDAENLLNVCAKGAMRWSVKNDIIQIDTLGGSVMLRYDPIARQMAIADPNARSVALYQHITCPSLPTVMLP